MAGLGFAWILWRPAPFALHGDNEGLTHPLLVEAFRQISGGAFPLWSSGRWGGSPLAADPIVGALYTPYYVGYALTEFPHWRALDIAVGLHLVSLTVGTVWLLAALGVRPWVAVSAVALLILNPTLVYAARHWVQYWTALCYWPWLLGAATRLVHRLACGPALVATISLAAQVYAGYPQFALYSGVVALAWLVAAPGSDRRLRVYTAILIGVGAVGLAAPQLLPTAALARDAARTALGADARMKVMELFAIPFEGWGGVFRGGTMLPLAPVKIAPGPALLALLGATQRRFDALFLAAACVITGLLATGPTPLYHALQVLPVFRFFGGPIKFAYLTSFLVMVLSGLGLDRVLRATDWQRRSAVTILVAVSLPVSADVMGLGAAVASGLLLLLATAAVAATNTVVVLSAIASAGLFLAGTSALVASNPGGPSYYGPFAALVRRPAPPPPVVGGGGRMVALAAAGGFAYQVGLNFGSLWGIEALNGVGPLAQWRQAVVLGQVSPTRGVPFVREIGANPVIVRSRGAFASALEGAGFRGWPDAGGLRVFWDPEPPRHYELVRTARAAGPNDALEAARAGDALSPEHAIIEIPSLPGGETGDPKGKVRELDRALGRYRVSVEVDRPTWLIVREPFYRNWRCTVDERPTALYPAGGFYQAMLIEPGRHVVRGTYQEPGLWWGAGVALLACAALPALFVRLAVASATRPPRSKAPGV